MVAERVRGALVQHAGGLTGVGIALDPSVRRVGGVLGETGDLQGLGVDPRSVHIAVEEERRPVADDVVKVVPGGLATGKVLHSPAATHDPRLVGVRGGVPRYRVT